MRCSIPYDMWQYTQTFLSGPWPRGTGIAVLSCPTYQVRMVGNTLKCSINAPFFVLPISLSYDYHLLKVSFLPSHLLFSWRHCWCMDHLVSTRTAGLSQWTLDSRKFLSWRRMAGVGIWGESSNQDRWWFIVCRNVYHPWVPKAQMMTEKNHKLSRIWKHSKSSVLVMKKITQEWSNLLNFSKTDHGC